MDRKFTSGVLQSVGHLVEFARNSVAGVQGDVASVLAYELHELERVVRNGPLPSISDLPAYIDAVKSLGGAGIDDRLHLLEKILVLMSRQPKGSMFAKRLEYFVIDILYKDLPHPPCGYLSSPAYHYRNKMFKRVPYAFRTVDGSNYNPYFPGLGQAGTPYARSVPSFRAILPSSLPDPGAIFDKLLRRDGFQPHPGGLSSLFVAFANIVIHSIFNTNREDSTINDASSYLDLSPLYGSSKEQLDRVRRRDGTGRLWEDVFADDRLLLMPPSVCALLILFNRNHNFIAEKILSINERGGYSFPPPTQGVERDLLDDEIFERARLVNCGFFMQIILRDYIGAILALVQDGLQWRLSPLESVRDIGHEFRPPGQGNAVSIEFNHLYRWHATISAQDEKWLEGVFRKQFGRDVDFRAITVEGFRKAVRGMRPGEDVKEWSFHGLQRTASGRFRDADLAAVLLDATEAPAGAFRARGIPEVMRVVEILAIEQSRDWGTCSLNEFRKFIAYSSFKEWNPLPEIHMAAETLYRDIDNLELHVGLQAEEVKRPSPGAGLCPGYTMSRAILADAISLTRGDPFLTLDFTPFNLTSWGYEDCMFNTMDGSHGGMLTKLLFRTLPSCYSVGSIYTHFPFLAPDYLKSRVVQTPDRWSLEKYSWSRPPPVPSCTVVSSYDSVSKTMNQKHLLAAAYDDRLRHLTGGPITCRELVNTVWNDDSIVKEWGAYFSRKTEMLIQQKSVDRTESWCRHIDIVGDVINVLPVLWFTNEFMQTLPEMCDDSNSVIRDRDLLQMFQDVGNYVLFNLEPALEKGLRDSAVGAANRLVELIRVALEKEKAKSVLLSADWIRSHLDWFTCTMNHNQFTAQLLAVDKGGSSPDDLARTVFSEIVPTAVIFSQILANVMNFYFHEDRKDAREDLIRLFAVCDPGARSQILAYIYEAIRLDPPMSGVHWTAKADISLSSSTIKSGTSFSVNIRDASLDADVFGPNPLEAVYHRPKQCTLVWDLGLNGFLGSKFFEETSLQILGVIFCLRDVQKVAGSSGEIKWIMETTGGITRKLYVDARGCLKLFASSLILQAE